MTRSLSPFDPKLYYRFSNANAKYSAVTISTGYKGSKSSIGFTASGSRSSENWQIYRQDGRYFLRNYDYGGEKQLGLTTNSPAVPQLLPRSGELGQQWMLDQFEDGTWRVTNALFGNASVLGVSDGISNREIAPAMNPSPDGSEQWIITVNLSAGETRGKGMLENVADLEAFPSAASAFLSPATSSSKGYEGTATTPLLLEAQAMHAPARSHTCTIAGMYVAFSAVALFLVAAGLIWRRRTRGLYQPIAVSDNGFASIEK